MMQTTTITQKWQMTIPKTVRDFLGLEKPGEVLIEVVDSKDKLIRLKKKISFLSLAGSLPAKNKKGERLDVIRIRDYLEKNYRRL